MLKKSFLLSLAIHALLGAVVVSMILLVHAPQPTIYIPLSLNVFKNQEKKVQQPACSSPKTAVKHPMKKPTPKAISKPKPKKPKPKPKKIIQKKIIKREVVKKTIPLHKIKKNIQKKKVIAKSAPAPKQITPTLAAQHTTNAPSPTKGNPAHLLHVRNTQISPQTQQKIKNSYLDNLYGVINANKVYPMIARKLSQTGVVKVSFTILKDGEIENIKLRNSSGFTLLDKAAQDILKKIAKFKPIPSQLHEDKLQIIIPIIYQLN